MINNNCSKEENRKCKCENNMPESKKEEMNSQNTRRDTNDCRRREMMMKIRELNFAVIELGLYLDTHEEDRKALCLHNHYSNELKELKDKYQKMYGPLTMDYPCNKWRWLEEPWPWERGNY